MDIIDSLDSSVMCEVVMSSSNNNNNSMNNSSTTTTTTTSKCNSDRGRGSSSGGSITIKTLRSPQQQPQQQQLLLGVQDTAATTFTLKQEAGGSVVYRVLQLPPEPLLDTSANLCPQQNTGNSGMPALLTTSDSNDTKLLLAADDSASAPGTIFLSGGQLYLVGDTTSNHSNSGNNHSIIISNGNSTSSNSSNSSLSAQSVANNTNTNLSPSSSTSSGLVLPRPITKAPGVITADSLSHRFTRGREDKRRVVHNEVERKRRDKINNWICRLAKILPNCPETQVKNANLMTSKAGILSKAFDYIQELQRENESLGDTVRKQQRQHQELQLLREQNNELKNENALLRQQPLN